MRFTLAVARGPTAADAAGLTIVQQAIIALLRGAEPPRVLADPRSLRSSELVLELLARRLLDERWPRPLLASVTTRACKGLLRRGLVEARLVLDTREPGRTLTYWSSPALPTENEPATR